MKHTIAFSVFALSLVAGAGCSGTDTESPSAAGAKSSSGGSGGGGAPSSSGGNETSGGSSSAPSGGGGLSDPGGGGVAGSAAGGADSQSSGGSDSNSSGGSDANDPLSQCKAQAASNPDPVCANCACDHCLDALKACQADPTCVALRDCVQQKNCGCSDQLCVLLKCGNELNAAGGMSGPGTAKAIAVRDCTSAANCTCCK